MTTTAMTTERKTVVRDMPDGRRVVAHLEIRHPGNPRGLSPGFSLTGEVYDRHGSWSGAVRHRNGREADISGAIHDDILRAFPRLAPFAAVHLSDLDGTPMHAEANASYYYPHAETDAEVIANRETLLGGPWLASAWRACENARRSSTGVYTGELLSGRETGGARRFCKRWAAVVLAPPSTARPIFTVQENTPDNNGYRAPYKRVGPMTWEEIAHRRAARALRMDPDELPRRLCKVAFSNLCEDLRERWRYDAHDARRIFDTIESKGGTDA